MYLLINILKSKVTFVNSKALMYKDILSKLNKKNTSSIKYILKKLLESYKTYRNYLEFHGNISQSSIVPSIKNKFDTNEIQDHDGIIGNNFYLSYDHQNMLTVKEWLHFRYNRLQKNSK